MPDYATIPVYEAAQAVQKSADGSAYQQYAQTGALLAADYTATPHAVTCWYNPAHAGREPGRLRQAQPARGRGGTGPRVRHARGKAAALTGVSRRPFGIG